MTYPPQQPGPYGQQPDPYGSSSSYQGLGAYSGGGQGGPPQRNTGKIVAIVLIVVMVLGGGGTAIYLLLKDDDSNNTGSGTTGTSEPSGTSDTPDTDQTTSSSPQYTQTTTEQTSSTDGPIDPRLDTFNSPEDVRDAYMEAYETKSFSAVVAQACQDYKDEYGLDTSKEEEQLEPLDIEANPKGELEEVNSTTVEADIELVVDGGPETNVIFIRIVDEDDAWRFCGEGERDQDGGGGNG